MFINYHIRKTQVYGSFYMFYRLFIDLISSIYAQNGNRDMYTQESKNAYSHARNIRRNHMIADRQPAGDRP